MGNSPTEDQLLKDLLTSRALSPGNPELPFFSRVGVSGQIRRTRGCDVAQAGKTVAKAHGYDPHHFSTTSNRISGISSLAKAGLDIASVQLQSGHASASVLESHYLQRCGSRMVAAEVAAAKAEETQRLSVLAFSPNAGWDEDDLLEQLMVLGFARARLRASEV